MKFTTVSRDENQLAEISRIIHARTSSDVVDALRGSLEQVQASINAAAPDVLVMHEPSSQNGDMETLEKLGHLHPKMTIIVLAREQTPDFLLRAMRAGVREVLPAPATAITLTPAISRIEEKLDSFRVHGKVLAVVSCKGGSGATFIATNLAYALSLQPGKRVALIDLNLQFGDAALFVSDQKPLATLSDVSQQIHRLDASFLASSMINITPSYALLAAPEDPTHADVVKPEHIDSILKLARRHYDFVVLDIGRSLDAVSIKSLDQADMIFPILQSTLPYIRDGKRLLGVFKSLDYPKAKIHLVLNRHEKGSEIRLRDFEAAFGSAEFRTIPNHYEAAAASVARGVSILELAKSSPVSKALHHMAHSLTGNTPQSQGWLGRMFSGQSQQLRQA